MTDRKPEQRTAATQPKSRFAAGAILSLALAHRSGDFASEFIMRVFCYLLLAVLCASGLLAFASVAAAAEGASGPFLQANFIYEFVADRGRMIQVSLVFVAAGCAMIWWYR